jgi:hypothetical protein
MNEWKLLRKKKPKDGEVVYVAFRDKRRRRVELCMYTPTFWVPWCVEDEGQWKGMSSDDCAAAWAWMAGPPEYPTELEG